MNRQPVQLQELLGAGSVGDCVVRDGARARSTCRQSAAIDQRRAARGRRKGARRPRRRARSPAGVRFKQNAGDDAGRRSVELNREAALAAEIGRVGRRLDREAADFVDRGRRKNVSSSHPGTGRRTAPVTGGGTASWMMEEKARPRPGVNRRSGSPSIGHCSRVPLRKAKPVAPATLSTSAFSCRARAGVRRVLARRAA